LIEKLMPTGLAYKRPTAKSKFSNRKLSAPGGRQYGQLVEANFRGECRGGERCAVTSMKKERWRILRSGEAGPADEWRVFWPSPWGEGRPGWHTSAAPLAETELRMQASDLHLRVRI